MITKTEEKMRREDAETVAAEALAWISMQPDLLRAFLDSTGLAPDMVKEMAQEPGFLGAVLDFLLGADRNVTGFCDAHGLAYDLPARARGMLPGGDLPHWT